jgi:hypothetical protein
MTPQLILIAGPYRSGTQGDPERAALNLKRLEQTALRVYQHGHMPMIGEWVALPLSAAAGSQALGDSISEAFLYPVAGRLVEQCDAVFRIEGESRGADEDVRFALELGKPVYRSFSQLPAVAQRR